MANYNPNLVKIHRNYTMEEVASLFAIHKNTVRQWVKADLPCMDDQKPYLILGADLKQFLQDRRAKKKQRCNVDEIYCLRCKSPQIPAENFVEYLPSSDTKGRITGFCPSCDGIINKYVSYAKLDTYIAIFEVSISKALEHINDTDKPLLNSDFI